MSVAGKQRARRASPPGGSATAGRGAGIVGSSASAGPIDQASLIFDPTWYVEQYPDVAAAGVDPVQHYLNTGFREGRNPNSLFDGQWYSDTYPDVAAHGENPFVHYLFYGAREGRKPRP